MKNVNIANAYKMKNAVKFMKTICATFLLEFVSKKKSKCLYSGLSNIFDNLEYFGMAAFSNGIIDYGSLCRCT